MNNTSNQDKYVTINPVTSSLELNLPEKYWKYSDDLKSEIIRKFSFDNLSHELENQIQEFISEYLQSRDRS